MAIVDAAGLTDMRTGAVTAIGARNLARRSARVLGHIGARGTAYWNVRLLAGLFDFDEIRVHSRRPDSRAAFAERLARDLGRPIVATPTGNRAYATPTSWSRLRACRGRSRFCEPNGSSAARSSFPTAR